MGRISKMPKISVMLKLLRPGQWVKNLVVFTALIFSAKFSSLTLLLKTIAAFIIFCAISGSCYALNDIFDMESDRKHPQKKYRPLASGKVNRPQALVLAFILAALSLSVSFLLDLYLGFTSLAYFLLILLYSILLKNFVLVDVMVVALGFVLRAVAGGAVIKVSVSPWLLLCSFLLALFLALGKRRYELIASGQASLWHNSALGKYTAGLLDQMLAIVASATVIAYSLYTFTAKTSVIGPPMMLTIPFVIFGIFRYLTLINEGQGGRPELILIRDKAIIIDIILWISVILFLMAKVK